MCLRTLSDIVISISADRKMNLQFVSSNLPVLIRHSTTLSCYGNIYIVNNKEVSLEDAEHSFILFTLQIFPWIQALLISTAAYILIMFPQTHRPSYNFEQFYPKKTHKKPHKKRPQKTTKRPKKTSITHLHSSSGFRANTRNCYDRSRIGITSFVPYLHISYRRWKKKEEIQGSEWKNEVIASNQ